MTLLRRRGARFIVSEELTESLPLPQRLALSYAPRCARLAILGLLALEQRLATVISMGGEAMIAQIKLAWWRERLSEPSAAWPSGEPLLEHLRGVDADFARWVLLVDGYESFLAEDFGRAELTTYLRGKALGWSAVADAVGDGTPNAPVEQAASELALFELDGKLTEPSEVALLDETAGKQKWERTRLPNALRPLAVLHSLARRARSREQSELLEGPRAMTVAMRVGLFGR